MPRLPVLVSLVTGLAGLLLVAPAAAEEPRFKVAELEPGDTLNVRRGPSTFFDPVLQLDPGAGGLIKQVCVLVKPDPLGPPVEGMAEWCAISEGEGVIGWVAARYLVADPDAGPWPAGYDGPLPLLDGFRASDDPCRITGENALTGDYLDHTATLVSCPVGDAGVSDLEENWRAERVAEIAGYVLLSVPD